MALKTSILQILNINMGAQLAKIACIHLVGHPLAQALFSNEQSIHDELLTQATNAYTSTSADGLSFTDSAGASQV